MSSQLAQRRLWQLTEDMTDQKVSDSLGRTYWRHRTTGLWWSKDTAGHADCAFKVYEKFGKKLIWKHDADEYGTFIVGKHKGRTGLVVYLPSLFLSLVSSYWLGGT